MRGHAWHARVRPLRTLRSGNRSRRIRVKRGNLYPEQRQIGMRVVSATQGGSPEHAGRRLEPRGNARSRGMIAGQRKLVYRIRPIVHPAPISRDSAPWPWRPCGVRPRPAASDTGHVAGGAARIAARAGWEFSCARHAKSPFHPSKPTAPVTSVGVTHFLNVWRHLHCLTDARRPPFPSDVHTWLLYHRLTF